jgi:hypothetical protein
VKSGSLIFTLLLICCTNASNHNAEISTQNSAQTLSLCNIISNPDQFLDKKVRIRGALRYGRHFVDLYSVRCNDPQNTTVSFGSADPNKELGPCSDDSRIETIQPKLMGEGTYLIDVEGKLVSSPEPPFENPFRYKFQASCINNRKVLGEFGNGPWAIAPDVQEKIEKYESGAK